jgi:hypothetical protein
MDLLMSPGDTSRSLYSWLAVHPVLLMRKLCGGASVCVCVIYNALSSASAKDGSYIIMLRSAYNIHGWVDDFFLNYPTGFCIIIIIII